MRDSEFHITFADKRKNASRAFFLLSAVTMLYAPNGRREESAAWLVAKRREFKKYFSFIFLIGFPHYYKFDFFRFEK